MTNPALRRLYWKTAAVSVLTALIVAVRFDPAWAAGFSVAALAGLLNWLGLGGVLIAYSEKRFADCLIWLPVKFLALGLFLGGLIVMEGVPISSFLCGFGMFLIVCAAEAAGSLLTGAWRKPAGAPQALATILSGNRTDA